MNVSKWIALVAIAGTVFTVGWRVALAQNGQCNNQVNMAHAMEALRSARGYLDHAEHNKGGWRDRAISSTDTALKETDIGCAYANTH